MWVDRFKKRICLRTITIQGSIPGIRCTNSDPSKHMVVPAKQIVATPAKQIVATPAKQIVVRVLKV